MTPATIAATVMIVAGCVFYLAGTVGLIRFPDAHTRLHALTKADNLGLGLVVLGLILNGSGVLVAAKLIAIWLLVLFSAATASQLLARTIRRSDGRTSRPTARPR